MSEVPLYQGFLSPLVAFAVSIGVTSVESVMYLRGSNAYEKGRYAIFDIKPRLKIS